MRPRGRAAFRIAPSVAILSAAMLGVGAAQAQPTGPARDIGTVSSTAGGVAGVAGPPAPGAAPGTAAELAPSRAPLDATQPTSVVGPGFIQRSVIPTQNYDSIIKFTPSVQNVETAGPGLQQNFFQTIRGFTYKQFNTTIDGIILPGTITSFAPQSGAYVMGHAIDSVEVDRGPGRASTIGYATFGGTVAIRTRSPAERFTVNPYVTAGSFGTLLRGIEVDSGGIPALGGARGLIDLQALDADGALTGISTRRRNAFIKIEAPIGANTLLTFGSVLNTTHTNTPIGATLDQIRRLGPKYGLNNDTSSQAFKGYNSDYYTTDIEYLKIRSELGDGWVIEDTPYTASYFRHGIVGLDPNGTTVNLTGRFFVNGTGTQLNNAVPGRAVHSNFRDIGNVFSVTKDTGFGQVRTGFWFDHNAANAYRTNVVLSQGNQPYTRTATATPYDYAYHASLTTYQPYIEFAATPLPGLVITPGLKYTSTTRGVDAVINQSTRVPANFRRTYDALQPSIDVRYTLAPGVAAYAQVAKGFLAPPLGVLQTLSPQTLTAQETINYQVGATWQTDAFSLSSDLYKIDFSNRIQSQNVAGTTIYFNRGGAIYQGIEAEGTVRLLRGLSVYANGSVNETFYKHTHTKIANAPDRTAAIGPIFDRDGLSASLLAKYVGRQYGQDTPADAFKVKSYISADFAAGYVLPILNGRKLDFRLNVDNVFNDRSIIGFNATAGDGKTGLYWTNPGRSAFISVAATL